MVLFTRQVYKASLVAMMAGADFIKTSTGKETVNATLTFGLVMCRAIKEYYDKMGCRVGGHPEFLLNYNLSNNTNRLV